MSFFHDERICVCGALMVRYNIRHANLGRGAHAGSMLMGVDLGEGA